MPTIDQSRILEDRARPRLMQLWWALQPLKSVTRFMQTGAHPDDETSGMLAALAFRDGINISYACSTRGEGGQNDIGTEGGADLGALRTREMERACDVLGMRMYWHSTAPEDTITDFGFSKSGDETLGRWGSDRTMHRFVEIVRTERPDILCPTFLDVPGQHGHHRAMTQAVEQVMAAAADPDYPVNLPPWQVKKLYLPAWSGAGQAYDDDLPPPPATLVINGQDREPVSGWSWERIGQQSRAYHRTQGMGRWAQAGLRRDWPLHLRMTRVDGPDDVFWAGVPYRLADLADLPGVAPISEPLVAADAALAQTVAAFPDFQTVAAHGAEALRHLTAAELGCPVQVRGDVAHRLSAKIAQLHQVLRLALGIEAHGRTDEVFVSAGDSTALEVELDVGDAKAVNVSFDLPQGWTVSDGKVRLDQEALPSDPYRAEYDPIDPPKPRMVLHVEAQETTFAVPLALDKPPVALPAAQASVAPATVLVNLASEVVPIALSLKDFWPRSASPSLSVPEGWISSRTDTGFVVSLPDTVTEGTYHLGLALDGTQASQVTKITHEHVAPTAHWSDAGVRVAVMDVALPKARVGYIGGGNDRVGALLQSLGVDVTDLSDADLTAPQVFADFDTVVVGIFAMRFRPGLSDAMPALKAWIENGGTLVTLYHRPWDNWDPDSIPPRRLEIGQPSLRWRVTNEAAKVTHLVDHEVLSRPNVIGARDWDAWVKERGLYFAKSWDAAYTPLLSMSDDEEAPLTGALLVADLGKGRHVHTSLILHHQMAALVPGAFRLMANLIAPRT